MLKKKKSTNKENAKNIKKVPLVTHPSFNYTQQLRIPSFSSTELKNMVRSIDLKKGPSANPYKKTISRKSTSKSVKQNPNFHAPKLKTMMREFEKLKLIHENERSKSRSPASCKSKSNKKYFPKKLSYHTLRTNPHSEANLTIKLEKTMKKLNQTDFFRDEDSLIPIKSSSDIFEQGKQAQILTDREQEINMNELREFCSTVSLVDKNSYGLSIKSYDSFKETMAALKIQKAWKRYQTKRLIERYVYLSHFQEESNPNITEMYPEEPFSVHESEQDHQQKKESQQIVSSEDFYHDKIEGERIRQVSNLQQEVKSASSEHQQRVRKMKLQELEKWNQIINMIELNKSNNPQELEKLLLMLTQQSEINKKELEVKVNQVEPSAQKKKKTEDNPSEGPEEEISSINQIKKIHKKQMSESDNSHGAMEEYDSRKYIQYLDGDIFPDQNDKSSHSSKKSARHQVQKATTISKRKQDMLLDQLKAVNLPIKLGESQLYRSQSMEALQGKKSQTSRTKSRQGLKKSTSEKTLKKTIQRMCESPTDIKDEQQINLELLTKQFLEGSDPSAENFDMVYSEERLTSKLNELKRMKHEERPEDDYNYSNQYIYEEDSNQHEDMGENRLQRSGPTTQLHQRSVQQDIKVEEEEEPQQMKIQVVEGEISSDSEDEVVDGQKNEKGEAVSSLLLNALILEVLKDIATSNKITTCFKQYSLSLRPRVRKSDNNKRKKGFPTTKAQIELFLQGLLKYLIKEEPHVFKNLEVATGPSAVEMLRYMHQSGQEEIDQQSDEDESNVMVIPNRVFDAFWQLKQKSIVIEVPESFDQTNSTIFKHQFQLLKSFNKIFYRSLFDTFNECLDCQRNFGQYGRPFPWKKAPVFYHTKTQQTIQAHVQSAKKKMMEVSTTYCGLIIQKEEMTGINEQYIQQVHQDRLSRMLASDLMQSEERWMFYDDEETEILVEISNAIYTEILIEVIEETYESF